MPTYPLQGGSGSQLTVEALLKQPRRISRDLVNLVSKRLVADRLFVRGSAEQVAGGAMQYQLAESIYLDTDPTEEIAAGADWPRSTWTEAILSEVVHQYGLEVLITNLMVRRHQMDQVTRAERKLANNLVRFIDTKAFALLENLAKGQNTQASAAAWSIAGTDIIAEVVKAQEFIETADNGYSGFEGATMVLNTSKRDDLLNNTVLRAALPREDRTGQIQTGMMAPFLGLKEILFSSRVTATKAIIIDTGVAGTIADEPPDPSEGFVGYDPGPGFSPIYVKVYEHPESKGKVVAAGRWPAMALTDPKAITVITGI
jgi:hypothetical protein